MKVSILRHNGLKLSQGAAILLLAGISAGCSSQSARFGGVDSFMTAATPNQREIIRPGGDTAMAGQQVAAAPMEPQYSGSVSRGSLPPPGADASAMAQPTQTAGIPLAPSSDATMSATAQQPAPQPSTSSAGGRVTVQPGDTIYGIARRHGVSANSILQANGMSPTDNLRSGSTIIVPGASGGATQVAAKSEPKASGQGTLGTLPQAQANLVPAQAAPAAPKTPAATTNAQPQPAPEPKQPEQVAAYTPPKKAESVIQQSEETAPDATGIGRMRWPVQGRVISQFGKGGGKANDGIDISVPEGTAIKAAENGVVIYAGDGLKEFGNTVLVRHEDGLVTVYGHASQIKVNRGDKVRRGQDIAVSGMSGQTDVPKLHFEVRKNSAPVNPATYLE